MTRILYPRMGALSPDRPKPTRKDGDNHGATSFGAVFVNDVGREAMFSKASPKFPIGSMIVREKLSSAPPAPSSSRESSPPLILVVMLKRESGFNPKANDWEFLTVSGDGKKIEKREKKGACLNCHQLQAKDDFVFRGLP